MVEPTWVEFDEEGNVADANGPKPKKSTPEGHTVEYYCPECGGRLHSGTRRCQKCGAVIERDTSRTW